MHYCRDSRELTAAVLHVRAQMAESIYGWIKEEPVAREKEPRYVSRHDPTAPVSTTLRVPKKPAATMGREVRATVDPTGFLKAKEKTAELPPPGSSRFRTALALSLLALICLLRRRARVAAARRVSASHAVSSGAGFRCRCCVGFLCQQKARLRAPLRRSASPQCRRGVSAPPRRSVHPRTSLSQTP